MYNSMLVTVAQAHWRHFPNAPPPPLGIAYAIDVIASEVDAAYAAYWGKPRSYLQQTSYAGPVVHLAIPAAPPALLVHQQLRRCCLPPSRRATRQNLSLMRSRADYLDVVQPQLCLARGAAAPPRWIRTAAFHRQRHPDAHVARCHSCRRSRTHGPSAR